MPGLLNKVNLRVASLGRKDNEETDDMTRCFPVDINPDKHPPPELPPPPDNLTENQVKLVFCFMSIHWTFFSLFCCSYCYLCLKPRCSKKEREECFLFNDALDTFYSRLYGRKEMLYLMTHSTHFYYSYKASDIWLRTILIARKETCCRHMATLSN